MRSETAKPAIRASSAVSYGKRMSLVQLVSFLVGFMVLWRHYQDPHSWVPVIVFTPVMVVTVFITFYLIYIQFRSQLLSMEPMTTVRIN